MSRTLFWYIFWDLVKIFGLASGVLSGIMSFGGLLRPLYEFGLDISQVGQILAWSGPAMTAYSLPIAALFATTMVYGRFSADNEITACRAAGMSHFHMATPALILGMFTALISLGLLCFVVPFTMLKVEKIIYSNLAKLVAEQIQRTHQVKFDNASQPQTIFAQDARVLPVDPMHPGNQAVQLFGPMIVTYEKPDDDRKLKKPQVPKEFYMATSAIATIQQVTDSDDMTLTADLIGGVNFPRSFEGGNERTRQVSFGTTRFGPVVLPSPVRENTKFMDILKLRKLLDQPENSREIRSKLREFITHDQQIQYLKQLADQLNGSAKKTQLIGTAGEMYYLTNSNTPAELRKDQLILDGSGSEKAYFVLSKQNMSVKADEIRIEAFPDSDGRRIELSVKMIGCTVYKAGTEADQESFTYLPTVWMPDNILALMQRPASAYVNNSGPTTMASATTKPGSTFTDADKLRRSLLRLTNSVISEIHARLSFAISCFILVMIGCTLGMMFRSGNFLSAFAVSVVPALLSIALVVTGQHTCENVGWDFVNPTWNNPLNLGIALIWSGNVVVFLAGAVLLGRLQRQ